MRPAAEVSDEEYRQFYKAISNDWDDCLTWTHFSVEGATEFKSIIYIPKNAPFDLFETKDKQSGIKLYVRRVFVTDKYEKLLPDWLNFIKGVVDSEDLPLNVSREMLQQNSAIKQIKKQLVKKALEMISDLQKQPEQFSKFYKAFGKNIKLGIYSDSNNRQKLTEFLRYSTSATHQDSALDTTISMR